MSSIIRATTSSGLQVAPDNSGSLQLQTNGTTTAITIDTSQYVQGTVNGLSAGRIEAWQYYRLNSGYAGSNVNTVQSIFGVGVTLVGSTTYEFEMAIGFAKAAGTTSHTVGIGFGGTATLNNIGYYVMSSQAGAATSILTAANTVNGFNTTASNTTISAAQTSATLFTHIIVKGTVSINAGGTLIPQYTLSAAPGGAYTTQIGSYIKIAPLAASGANVNVGSWA